MTSEESLFLRAADQTIQHIADVAEDTLGDNLDIDIQGGILTIECEDGRQYVLNKHAPNQELWLSSPLSGAWHFTRSGSSEWRATRDATIELHVLLAGELEQLTGQQVVF